jgi:hypothetical protein
MTKNKYEQQRDENVRKIQDHFKSLGITLLSHQVRDALSNKPKGKGKKIVSNKPGSDLDYDPTSNIDNHSDTDDDSNHEVRCNNWAINNVRTVYFKHVQHFHHVIYLRFLSYIINNMYVSLDR